jgi:hypothetical protein
MKTLLLVIAVALATVGLWAQPQPEYVFPKTNFDAEAARLALEPGTATLRGVASTKANKIGASLLKRLTHSYPARRGTTITLFPCTPYFEEWYELRQKFGKGKRLAVMSPLAYSHRLVAKVTDDEGTFTFPNLKPGRYYLEAVIAFTQQHSQKVQTGVEISSGYGNININPVYTRYYYDQADRGYVQEFVDVAPGASVVEVKLR